MRKIFKGSNIKNYAVIIIFSVILIMIVPLDTNANGDIQYLASVEVDADADGYSDSDMAAFNSIIDKNGTGLTEKNMPETWPIKWVEIDGVKYIETLTLDTNYGNSWNGQIDVSEIHYLDTLDIRISTEFGSEKVDKITGLMFGPMNTNLTSLSCFETNISDLDITDLSNLKTLRIYKDVELETLDFSQSSSLEDVTITYAYKLKTLDFTGASNIQSILCGDFGLTSIDISGLDNLKEVITYGTNLTSLDATKTPNLSFLQCYESRLTNLNVNGLQYLESLVLGYNQLHSIDLQDLPSLAIFNCTYNPIQELITVDGATITIMAPTAHIRPDSYYWDIYDIDYDIGTKTITAWASAEDRGFPYAFTRWEISPTIPLTKGTLTDPSISFIASEDITVTLISEETVQPGDTDGNGTINIFDIMGIRDHIFGTRALTAEAVIAADVDGNGVINIFDIMKVRDHIFGRALL